MDNQTQNKSKEVRPCPTQKYELSTGKIIDLKYPITREHCVEVLEEMCAQMNQVYISLVITDVLAEDYDKKNHYRNKTAVLAAQYTLDNLKNLIKYP